MFHCNRCSKVFEDPLALKRHLSIKHFNYSPYLCKICKKLGQLLHTATEEDMDRHFETVHPGTEQRIILSKKKDIDVEINAAIEECRVSTSQNISRDFKSDLQRTATGNESTSSLVSQDQNNGQMTENGSNVLPSKRTQESPLNSEGHNNQATSGIESNLSNSDAPIFALPVLKSFEKLPTTSTKFTLRGKLISISARDKDLNEIDSIESAIQTPLQNSSNNSDAKLIQRKRTLPQNDRDIRTEPPSKRSNPKIANGTEKRYKCVHCSYASASKANLNKHVRTHTGEKPFKCGHCSYACADKSALNRHLRIHTGEKPFKCDKCKYASARSNDLKLHMRTHTGEKPFKCSHCSYACAKSSDLKDHIRIHTGEKPFKCNLCSYASARNDTLNVHIRTHTGEKPYKCSECVFAGTSRSHLYQHVRNNRSKKTE